ncbi:hypothetical protein WA026_010296 [Henosepilachna vigintioctopunctata]|uniref:Uncharacterized protein n=1 Tax=Henosepilachna vigintioctopunctata TaxID=420089 RepID=A0AAW1UCP2_9CUCU
MSSEKERCVICENKDAGKKCLQKKAITDNATFFPTFLLPERHGWTIKDNRYEFKWFEGDCMPQTVLDAIKIGSTSEQNSDNEDNEQTFYDQDMFSSDDSTEEESEDSGDED